MDACDSWYVLVLVCFGFVHSWEIVDARRIAPNCMDEILRRDASGIWRSRIHPTWIIWFGNGNCSSYFVSLHWCWLILILLQLMDPKIQMDPSSDSGAGSQGGRTSDPSSGEDGRRQFGDGTVSSLCFSPAGMIWCNWPTSEVWPVGSEKNGEHMEERWPPRGDKNISLGIHCSIL